MTDQHTRPRSTARQIGVSTRFLTDREIVASIEALLQSIEVLRVMRTEWMPVDMACAIDDVVAASEFLKPGK